jgi:hypothetical protein
MKFALTSCTLVVTTALLTVYGASVSADSKVYRWKDEAGNQVNSDQPPPQGIKYEVISIKSSMVHPADEGESAAAPVRAPAGTATDNGAKPVPVEAKKPASQKDPESCSRAKNNLLQIDSHGQIRLRDDQGNVRYLTDEEKQAERKKALDAIKVFCE